MEKLLEEVLVLPGLLKKKTLHLIFFLILVKNIIIV